MHRPLKGFITYSHEDVEAKNELRKRLAVDAKVYKTRGAAYTDKGEFDKAIENYNTAIKLRPNLAEAYSNRGEAWLHRREWEKAKTDLTTAKNMDYDIVASFHSTYKSAENFEKRNSFELPKDIAAILTKQ